MGLEACYKLIETLIHSKKKIVEELTDPSNGLHEDHDVTSKCIMGFARYIQNDVEWLETIKSHLPRLIQCSHPKEMRDRCGNQWYCKNCNENLG